MVCWVLICVPLYVVVVFLGMLYDTVRLLLVVQLVLYYAYQTFGAVIFQSAVLERLARWGAVHYSSLFCLEGFVLALKYGRNPKTASGDSTLDTANFFKTHVLEIYPLYLVATVSYFVLEYLLTGVASISQLLMTATTLDVST